jgi:hypothetical protein
MVEIVVSYTDRDCHIMMKGYGVATLAQNKIFYPINQELLLL